MSHSNAQVEKLHNALVDKLLREKSIRSAAVEAAFRAVPRHLFLPDVTLEKAYTDDAIPTKFADNQPISSSSQPSIMAIMLEQLDLRPGLRVLEIGAGTGYNAALLAHLVGQRGRVTSVDLDQDIVEGARRNLDEAGFSQVDVQKADGILGYAASAPYDRIILTVGAQDVPPAWFEQLEPTGRIVLPLLIGGGWQACTALVWAEDDYGLHLRSLSTSPCGFMTLRGELAPSPQRRMIQIQPRLNLYIQSVTQQAEIETDTVYRLLNGAYTDHPLQPLAPNYDQLGLWLDLHDPAFCGLTGEESAVPLVPFLHGQRGKFHMSMGLLDGSGLALLLKDPVLPAGEDTYPLFMRVYAGGEAVAERLAAAVNAWEAAKRPDFRNLRLRIYPLDPDDVRRSGAPRTDEYILARPWSTIVVTFER
ncbi:MAG: methyltransferase domain-containing protein [bacterium]|nr:methyltransferase domain-containing protein [bacterium]